eukprot:TRINITY_DN8821_c0_g1_i2.p1 TRINITY_DN8821_c0_g1~~TRINITY_DN8821_c0_g1_i2.p1  ORF type:complete len:415 (-),score=89.91 TRINITY_DN8821_c0_g1_i2:141-1247(-)
MAKDTQAWLLHAARRKLSHSVGESCEDGIRAAGSRSRRKGQEHGSEELARVKCAEGDALFSAAQGMKQPPDDMAQCWDPDSLKTVVAALHKFQAAIAAYSEALEVMPCSHEVLFKRASCYESLEDWSPCQEDALRAVQLRPDFVAAWVLLAQALWQAGAPQAARRQLSAGLHYNPNNDELLELKTSFTLDVLEAEDEGSAWEMRMVTTYTDPSTPSTAAASSSSTPAASFSEQSIADAEEALLSQPSTPSPFGIQEATCTARANSNRMPIPGGGLPQVGANSPARMPPKDFLAVPVTTPSRKEARSRRRTSGTSPKMSRLVPSPTRAVRPLPLGLPIPATDSQKQNNLQKPARVVLPRVKAPAESGSC